MNRPIRSFAGLAALVLSVACSEGGGIALGGLDALDVTLADTADSTAPEAGDTPPGEVAEAASEAFVRPEWQALAPESEGRLQALLDDYVYFSGDPGMAAAVLVGGTRLWKGAAGQADVTTNAPLGADLGFRVGSNSKPYVATLVAGLVEEGRLGFDDDITTFVPGYPEWQGVTLRHLLGMRSGIPDYLWSDTLWLQVLPHRLEPIEPEALLDVAKGLPMEFAPGEGCSYSNTNYILAGLAIEAVTGQALAEVLRERLVEPLGLKGTYLDENADPADTLAHGYMDIVLAAYALGVPPEMMALLPPELYVTGSFLDATTLLHPDIAWAAGGIVSTVEDAVVFMRALVRGDLVGPDVLAEMTTFSECRLGDGELRYGLGLHEQPTSYGMGVGHGGLIFGYHAAAVYVADADLAFSQMHNTYPDQAALIEERLLAHAAGDDLDEPAPCAPPEGFPMAPANGPWLEVRFRGPVNDDADASPAGAVARFVMNDGQGGTHPLYGMYSLAKLEKKGASVHLDLGSFGPAYEAGVTFRSGALNLAPEILAKRDETGRVDLAALPWYALTAVTLDHETDAAGRPVRFCVTAVRDAAGPASLFVCEAFEASPEVGDLVRVYATVAMKTDPAAIEQFVAPLGLARCMCASGETWAPCGN